MAFLSIAKIVCYVNDKNSDIWTRRPLRRIKGLGKQLFWDRLYNGRPLTNMASDCLVALLPANRSPC